MVNIIRHAILILWQLPQVVLGGLVALYLTAQDKAVYNDQTGFWNWHKTSGLSLSEYFIFVNKYAPDFIESHEEGHALQSIALGPLYLIVIGLPSLIWAGLKSLGFFRSVSYFAFYTEKWANAWGDVVID